MSAWRKEASERLPELQRIIASREVDSPMMLWIELNLEFERRCKQEPVPIELLKRLWGYAKWCMGRGDDVGTGAALGFCEHLIDTKESRSVLPKIMSRQDYLDLKPLLLYHNSEPDYEEVLKGFKTVAMKPKRKKYPNTLDS
jgi:hypothetical protein